MLTDDNLARMIDLYFAQPGILFDHLFKSYNDFIEKGIYDILTNGDNIFFEKVTAKTVYRYRLEYVNISVKPPMLDNEEEYMFPQDARNRNLSYSSKLVATVKQMQDTIDIMTDTMTTRQIGKEEHNVPLAIIPIMVKSKYCSLSLKKGYDTRECEYDPGGYFIVNGSEKMVLSIERLCENKPLVFKKQNSGGIVYTVQVNSKSYKVAGLSQIVTISMRKDKILNLRIQLFNELPVFMVLRAMGIETDREIMDLINPDPNDIEMISLIKISLDNFKGDILKSSRDSQAQSRSLNRDRGDRQDKPIVTQEDALEYLATRVRLQKNFTEGDKEARQMQMKQNIMNILDKNFLPHIEGGKTAKLYYIGYMINRLLSCVLERRKFDDRDDFRNKRIDLVGDLFKELLQANYKKVLSECFKIFKKRNTDDNNPINIINQIRSNIIEQNMKSALLRGTWGKKVGVAQMLQRQTYIQTVSFLRRIDALSNDISTSKLIEPRQYHASQVGFLCPGESPDGSKVGFVKNLSLIANVTITNVTQMTIIKEILSKDKLIPHSLEYTKVFLNGDWLGTTKTPNELVKELRELKKKGILEPTTSIAYNILEKEIKLYTEGGRLFRLILKVENNDFVLKADKINQIAKSTSQKTGIKDWITFMIENAGAIEYIDVEEACISMIAPTIENVYNMKKKMELAKSLPPTDTIVNRYDDRTFIRYTHCEIHPSLLLGVIASSIPFANDNQGPRVVFYYAQGKQAMGIPTSNYRHRLDISYILYHPQRPLVSTRTTKYTNTDVMAYGENIVVAICCYSGFNQEDSVILNKDSVKRGLLLAESLKKVISIIKKNQTTSQDDIFAKPDPTTLTNKRMVNYDKLNDQGYAPEETVLYNNDIVLGKLSPVPPGENPKKRFKDTSDAYKSHEKGTVDKVYINIYDADGYGMRKARIRSQRTPRVGDKFGSKGAQKGTCGLLMSACDMPFSENGIIPDMIVNPCAFPGRMTISQNVECLVGKTAVLMGKEADGTAFNNIDLGAIKKDLASMGYRDDGTEYLYSGITGEKIKTAICIGPTYYHRLKQMVVDKMHSRARGPRTILTRQPPEGRSRDGGLKLGEMERDAIISHGLARFLKERLMDTSDAYICHICDICGLFAHRIKNSENNDNTQGVYICPACNNKKRISKIKIPYAFKLLLQELMAMSIAPRVRTLNTIYNS